MGRWVIRYWLFIQVLFSVISDKTHIYFIAIIDPTNYGFKKQVSNAWNGFDSRFQIQHDFWLQAAKAAKTVKYGSNVDGISTCDPHLWVLIIQDQISIPRSNFFAFLQICQTIPRLYAWKCLGIKTFIKMAHVIQLVWGLCYFHFPFHEFDFDSNCLISHIQIDLKLYVNTNQMKSDIDKSIKK